MIASRRRWPSTTTRGRRGQFSRRPNEGCRSEQRQGPARRRRAAGAGRARDRAHLVRASSPRPPRSRTPTTYVALARRARRGSRAGTRRRNSIGSTRSRARTGSSRCACSTRRSTSTSSTTDPCCSPCARTRRATGSRASSSRLPLHGELDRRDAHGEGAGRPLPAHGEVTRVGRLGCRTDLPLRSPAAKSRCEVPLRSPAEKSQSSAQRVTCSRSFERAAA